MTSDGRPRDSQRAKILACCNDFRALRPVEVTLPFQRSFGRDDWDRAQGVLNTYLRQPWFDRYAEKYDLSPESYVRVWKSKHGSDHLESNNGYWRVNLSPARFDKLELLRYVGQVLTPPDVAWHGPEFVRAFTYAIEKELGEECRKTMQQVFRLRKVRRRIESQEVRERQKEKYNRLRTEKAVSRLQETLRQLEG